MEFVANENPKLRPFITDVLDEDTVIVVHSRKNSFVTDKGVLYLSADGVSYFNAFLFEFLTKIRSGTSINDAYETLVNKLMEKSYECQNC